jgi:hypothetical protein
MTIQKRKVKASYLFNAVTIVNERVVADLRAQPGTLDVRNIAFDGEYLTYEVTYDDDLGHEEAGVEVVNEN